MFTLTIFEILLSEGTSLSSPAQRDTGIKRIKVSGEYQKTLDIF